MIRAAILGASGYVGGELMRLIAAHPEIDGGAWRSARRRRASRSRRSIRTSRWPIRDMALRRLGPGAARRLRPDLRRAAAWRDASGWPTTSRRPAYRWSISAPTSGSTAPTSIERWYGEPHQRPDLLGSFVYGLPEFFRAEIAAAKRVAAPGCYPTAANLALQAADRRRRDRAQGHHRRCRLGRQRRRARGQCGHAFLRGRRQFPRLWPDQPPPHRRNGDGVGRARCCSRRICAPTSRGILATCYAKATGTVRSAGDPARRLCRRALRPCRRGSARDQMGDRLQRRLPHRRAMTSAPAWSSRSPRSTISARARRGR